MNKTIVILSALLYLLGSFGYTIASYNDFLIEFNYSTFIDQKSSTFLVLISSFSFVLGSILTLLLYI